PGSYSGSRRVLIFENRLVERPTRRSPCLQQLQCPTAARAASAARCGRLQQSPLDRLPMSVEALAEREREDPGPPTEFSNRERRSIQHGPVRDLRFDLLPALDPGDRSSRRGAPCAHPLHEKSAELPLPLPG